MIDPKKGRAVALRRHPAPGGAGDHERQAGPVDLQARRSRRWRTGTTVRQSGTRNLEGYNGRVSPEERLPYWVIIVDELADLMMQSGPEIETGICRLAQLARPTGIHLVIATQRPSVNVITGTIKANISSRIAFAVNSAVDSRTILDMTGRDRLIGRGDMLFMPIDAAKPQRIQGCFVSEKETEDLVAYLKEQAQPNYEVLPSSLSSAADESDEGEDEPDDDLFESAVKLVVTGGQASTSMLQRRFKIGYTRAARLVDLMEQRGIVGPLDGAKPRDILMTRDQIDALFTRGTGAATARSDAKWPRSSFVRPSARRSFTRKVTGRPMADNTLQFEWIVTIKGNLDALFRDDPEVFVAGDLLWYPVEGDNRTRVAPDVLVAFGRPKGYRGAYLQWQEAGIAPQVVFEILSPGNRLGEMLRKRDFYERFGVEEYYLYDPDRFDLTGWRRAAEGTGGLRVLETASAWTSPRLGIRFEVAEGNRW
jgi:Uma2 family endonuclease